MSPTVVIIFWVKGSPGVLPRRCGAVHPPPTCSCKYVLWHLGVLDILAVTSILLFLERWKITGAKRLAEERANSSLVSPPSDAGVAAAPGCSARCDVPPKQLSLPELTVPGCAKRDLFRCGRGGSVPAVQCRIKPKACGEHVGDTA